MKKWLTRLYPRPWRERYEAEFQAMLEEYQLSVWDLLDIARGALDAHWTAFTSQEQELLMINLTISIHRRSVIILVTIALAYLLSYGALRATGLLVHTAQNRYTAGSYHSIVDLGSPVYDTPLTLVYAPLRLVESVGWPIVDTLVHAGAR
jgi:hypothetical protein